MSDAASNKMQMLAQTPPVDNEAVSRIKEAIKRGEYPIDVDLSLKLLWMRTEIWANVATFVEMTATELLDQFIATLNGRLRVRCRVSRKPKSFSRMR